jgi:endonuclease YncB( thermonuclease family)
MLTHQELFMSHFNTNAVNTAVVAALKAAASFQQRVADLRATLDKRTLADRDALTIALRPGVARFYGIECAEHGTTGKFVTDDDKLGMAARTALSKLVRSVQGVSVAHTSPVKVRVRADERAAANAFLAQFDGDIKRAIAVLKAVQG